MNELDSYKHCYNQGVNEASWEQRKKHLSVFEDIKKCISLKVIFGLSVKRLAKEHKAKVHKAKIKV